MVLAHALAAAAGGVRRRPAHIVDELIAERAPRLGASPLWPLVRPVLHTLLGYGRARAMADAIRPLSGAASLDHVSRLLSLRVKATGLERVPPTGRCLVVCNHPTGIADGIAVADALRRVRDDLIFFANADALRVSPRLGEVLIPVEWVEAKRSRETARATLEAARRAFEAERCVVMFPAGRLARADARGRLLDPPWAPTAATLARKHAAPVIPLHLTGPWSRLFHLFHRVSPELRDITLFHEMLNKRGGRFGLTVGRVIDPAALAGDAGEATAALKRHVEQALAADSDAVFAR